MNEQKDDTITEENAPSLTDALESGRWFAHASWSSPGLLQPYAYRWNRRRLEKARRDALDEVVYSERYFSPSEVMSRQWQYVRDPSVRSPPRRLR